MLHHMDLEIQFAYKIHMGMYTGPLVRKESQLSVEATQREGTKHRVRK